ncbi:hypothetical protein Cni_G05513 [Canna indica]|uniref:Uncharacterized protein n=1 Tax=Canna indica TaxID=4628 RepID=A0AAQ3Q523_9LILI|nr:hypothetical protein Cni_G05513 [Canna indica]
MPIAHVTIKTNSTEIRTRTGFWIANVWEIFSVLVGYENNMMNPRKEANPHKVESEGSTEQKDMLKNSDDSNMKSNNGKVVEPNIGTRDKGDTCVVYTDVTLSLDDVIRAGGLGARDDISSVLPVAIDSTDFEASLRDARDFEEPQGQIRRPGLGWTESVNIE